MCYNMWHKKRWGIFMGIFDQGKNTIDEKRYKQILAEEELEEEYFNREHSFKKIDDKVKKAEEKQEKQVIEEYVDNTDYDAYYDDYANFNTIKEDYDDEEDYETTTTTTTTTTTHVNEEYEDADDSYTFDKSMVVSIVSNIYKWFVIIAAFLAVILIMYLLFKAKFIAVFLYIISLVCAFMFGYIVMFAVNYLFFKE